VQTDRGCTPSLLTAVSCISFLPCGTPFYYRSVSLSLPRVLFVVSTLLPIRRFTFVTYPTGEGEWDCRALFIQLPYLNVALTRRKIICKNPHKICKPPLLMHREIVALYRHGIIISLSRPLLTSITGRAGKKGTRFSGPALKFRASPLLSSASSSLPPDHFFLVALRPRRPSSSSNSLLFEAGGSREIG